MKIPISLVATARIAAAAFALVLTIATPVAHTVLADDSGLPPAPTTPTRPSVRLAEPDPSLFSQGGNAHDSIGHRRLWFAIKNVGLATSKSISVDTFCTYMIPVGAFADVPME